MLFLRRCGDRPFRDNVLDIQVRRMRGIRDRVNLFSVHSMRSLRGHRSGEDLSVHHLHGEGTCAAP